MFPLVAKVAIGLGVAVAGWFGYETLVLKKGVMTPEDKLIFDTAMRSCTDPAKLRVLADAFDKKGLHDAANQLRTRAATLEAPASVQAGRQAAANAAAATTDPSKAAAVQNVANAFATSGDPATAEALTLQAQQLAAQANTTPAIPPMPVTPYDYPNPFVDPTTVGTVPVATAGVATGDNLGAVQSGVTEAPKGYPSGGGDVYREREGV